MPDFQAFKMPSARHRQARNVFGEDDEEIPSTSGPPQASEAGNLAAGRKEWSTALTHWEAALRQNPEHQIAAKLLEHKAQVLMELGRTFEAIKAATRAAEYAPDFGPAFLTLGRAQLNFGEPEYAVHSLEKAIKLDLGVELATAAKLDLADARNLQLQRRQQGVESSGTRVSIRD